MPNTPERGLKTKVDVFCIDCDSECTVSYWGESVQEAKVTNCPFCGSILDDDGLIEDEDDVVIESDDGWIEEEE